MVALIVVRLAIEMGIGNGRAAMQGEIDNDMLLRLDYSMYKKWNKSRNDNHGQTHVGEELAADAEWT